MSKGSKRRPGKGYEDNYDRIFGMKLPKVGQRVMVSEKAGDQVREGTVQSVLSTQFTYVEDDTDLVWFCDGDWEWRDNEPR
jgi:phage baseplate assembly protein gpV